MEQTNFQAAEQPLLLCWSKSPALLATRSLVLASRYRVTSLSSIADLKALPESGTPQLLVLCHTLSADECQAAIDYSEARYPRLQVLSMTKSRFENPEQQTQEVVFAASDGPIALLSSVASLLGQ